VRWGGSTAQNNFQPAHHMITYIDKTLGGFRKCFSREKTFELFVIITFGLMIVTDSGGVTSFIRELDLDPFYYRSLLGFFRSSAWSLWEIRMVWISLVMESKTAYKYKGYYVLLGDGTVQSKEGKKMPGVSSVHQDSADVNKSSNTLGHMFGCIGLVIGTTAKLFACPLTLGIQNFDSIIRSYGPEEDNKPEYARALQLLKNNIKRYKDSTYLSHPARIIVDAGIAAMSMGNPCMLVLDRLFMAECCFYLCQTMFTGMLFMVTKAKSSCTAFLEPEINPHKRGPKSKKGDPVHVWDLFLTKSDKFAAAEPFIYGDEKDVSYYSDYFLWGESNPMMLMFVLVRYGAYKCVLMTNNLTLKPIEVIELYGLRFKIEAAFFNLKHSILGFAYHFWSMYMPKLKGFNYKAVRAALEAITNPTEKARIYEAMRAIEIFVSCAGIAIGIVQICVLKFSENVSLFNRYLRTNRSAFSSVQTILCFLRKNFSKLSKHYSDVNIFKIISKRQKDLVAIEDLFDQIA
jgi:hypothetical protein